MPKLDELDDKRRQKTMRQSIKDLSSIFDNSDGLKRLRAIDPDKWRRAEERDAAQSKG
jgi:hypothetical protein